MRPGSVSAIMPARNAAATIAESLRSVLAQPEVGEVVVVDDGSTDGTGAVVAGMGDGRVRVVAGPARGISAALNAGFGAATLEYVARCDADDLFVEGRLARQVEWLSENPEYDCISGGFRTITAGGRLVADLSCDGEARDVTDALQRGEVFTHFGSWLVRRAVLERAGGAREWFVTAEDVDLQARLAFYGRVWFDPRPVYQYRLHDASITHRSRHDRLDFYDSAARRFAAQRRERGSDDLEDGCPPQFVPAALTGGVNGASRHASGQLVGSAWRAFDAGDRREAMRWAWRAVSLRPGSVAAWKTLGLVAVRLRSRRSSSCD